MIRTSDPPAERAMRWNRPSEGRPGGFTLIELAMVVLILAIITAVGLPSFSRFQRKSALSAEGSKLVQSLQYAQQRSVLEGEEMEVVVDVDERAYWVPVIEEDVRRQPGRGRVRTSRREEVRKALFHKLGADYVLELFYYPLLDQEVTRGESSIRFFPDGTADAVYLTLVKVDEDPDKEYRIFIKIMGTTGLVKSYVGRNENTGWDFFEGRLDDEGNA